MHRASVSVGDDRVEGGYLLPTMDTYKILGDGSPDVDHDDLRDALANGMPSVLDLGWSPNQLLQLSE